MEQILGLAWLAFIGVVIVWAVRKHGNRVQSWRIVGYGLLFMAICVVTGFVLAIFVGVPIR